VIVLTKIPRLHIIIVALIILVGLMSFISIGLYLRMQNQLAAFSLRESSLQHQLEDLQQTYNNYKLFHSHSDSEYNSLQSIYDDYVADHNHYVANHHYSDVEVEDIRFFFYYDEPRKQEFGVYNLEDELEGLEWDRPYEEHVFDCSEMSASLERYLENHGWHTKIVCGDTPFGSGRHSWLLVETSEGKYMPVESTIIEIVWWENPDFYNYFEYDRSFETIQEALEYSETSYDWWNS